MEDKEKRLTKLEKLLAESNKKLGKSMREYELIQKEMIEQSHLKEGLQSQLNAQDKLARSYKEQLQACRAESANKLQKAENERAMLQESSQKWKTSCLQQ